MNDPRAYQEINQLWSLVDTLTVEQAAALIAGFDSNSIDESGNGFKNGQTGLTDSEGIAWVQTALTPLVDAVNAVRLKATIRHSAWERGVGRRAGRR